MVKMFGERAGRKFLGIGLSHGNVERLMKGQPIHFNAEAMGLLKIDVSEVVIFVGETEDAIREELQQVGALDGTHIIEDQRKGAH